MPYAIIADDLTGAADAGAPFAQAGLRTYLALRPPALDAVRGPALDAVRGLYPTADVLVVSSESRHLPPGQAYVQTATLAAEIGPASLVYKKMDSTLRGNAGAELHAVMAALGATQALVAPAFPAQGRTTAGGRQLVNGLPLEQTPFAHETATSDIATYLRRDMAQPITIVPLATVRSANDLGAALRQPGIVIADAETDDDLAALAQGALACGLRLLCGSAGLARALAGVLPLPDGWDAPVGTQRAQGPVLVVAGSRHPRTRRQVYAAADSGAVLIAPGGQFISDPVAFAHTVDTAEASLAAGQHTIVSTVDMADLPVGGEAVAAGLGRLAELMAARTHIGALVLTGGDIAVAVLRALGTHGVWLQGEVESGIPWGILHGGALPGIPVVSKAGGFGTEDVLAEAIEFLSLQVAGRARVFT